MRTTRWGVLPMLASAILGATLGTVPWASPAVAQQPGSGTTAPVTTTSSGTYGATVGSTGQTFQRSGTYEARVSFSAAVTITSLDIASLSGTYTASGPFTATVSAPDVAAFPVTGTYTASGTFGAGTFTSSGGWTLTSGGSASGTHRGGGTYSLAQFTATANGTYEGTVTDSPRGALTVNGPYGGSGTFTAGVQRMTSATTAAETMLQIQQITDMLAGIVGIAATGPAAATAIEMRTGATPPATGGTATAVGFAGTIAPAGLSFAAFTGSTAQLAAAAASAKATTIAATVNGRMLAYVVGAPAFVNAEFLAAFPSGLTNTLVVVRT